MVLRLFSRSNTNCRHNFFFFKNQINLATLTNHRNNFEAALNRVNQILLNDPEHLDIDQLTQHILQELDHNFNIRNLVNHLIRPIPDDIINRLELRINGIDYLFNNINLQLYNTQNRLHRTNAFNQTTFAQDLPDEVVGRIMTQTGGAALVRTPSEFKRHFIAEYKDLMNIQGIISAHGSEIQDRLCLIPDNIIIRPATGIGQSATSEWMNDMVEYYLKANDRRILNEFTEGYGMDSQAYYPGSLLPELNLHFRVTFPPALEEKHRNLYGDTGIITGSFDCPEQDISCIIRNITPEMKANDILLKNSSMVRNDQRIYSNDELWDQEILLSNVLSHISKKIKEQNKQEIKKIPNTYILQVCRGTSNRQIITEIDALKAQQLPEGYTTEETLEKIKSTSEVTGPFIHFKKNLGNLIDILNDEETSKIYLSKVYPLNISQIKNSSFKCNHYGPLKLKQNSRVKIHSLRGARELNDKIGNIEGYNSEKERYVVKIDKNEKAKLLKEINLEPIEQIICSVDDCEEACNILRDIIIDFLNKLNSETSISTQNFAVFELLREGILPKIIFSDFEKKFKEKFSLKSKFSFTL